MKSEKSTGPRMDPCGTPRRIERNDFCDFEKPRKRAYQKGKIESNKQSRKEASRNEFVQKGGMPHEVKSFQEINSSKDRPRSRPGFVKIHPKWTKHGTEYDLE